MGSRVGGGSRLQKQCSEQPPLILGNFIQRTLLENGDQKCLYARLNNGQAELFLADCDMAPPGSVGSWNFGSSSNGMRIRLEGFEFCLAESFIPLPSGQTRLMLVRTDTPNPNFRCVQLVINDNRELVYYGDNLEISSKCLKFDEEIGSFTTIEEGEVCPLWLRETVF